MQDSLVAHFLIAVPTMADPNFIHGVTLICQHDETGAMGLTINRPSDYTLGELMQHMQIEAQSPAIAAQRVLSGGPVQTERGFVLHSDERDWEGSLRFGEGLAVSTSRDILEALARGEGPASALVTLGYAGWTAGQLESEMTENIWLAVPAARAIIFEVPLEERWHAAAKSIGLDLSRLSSFMGHA